MTAPTITEFIGARLGEWEQAAREAAKPGNYPHLALRPTAAAEVLDVAEGEGCARTGIDHFAMHDPAATLALVAAIRCVVEVHVQHRHGCAECGEPDGHWPCYTVAKLAAAWAGHDDYRQEWAS